MCSALIPSPAVVDEPGQPAQPGQPIPLALRPRIAGANLAEVFDRQHNNDAKRGSAVCHILDVRYVPGDSSTILYQLGERLVIGRLGRNELSAEATGTRRVIAPLEMQAYLFPDDPALPGLATVLDPQAMACALTSALPECRANAFRVLRCRVMPLRYRPGRRCTLQLELRLRDNQTGAMTSRTFFGKVYHDVAKAMSVYGAMQMLTAAAPLQDGHIRLARPVAFLPDLALVLQEPVAGTPLDMLFGRLQGAASAGSQRGWNGTLRAATALATLHKTRLTTRRERLIATELARFKQRAASVALADTVLGGRMGELAAALSTWLEQPAAWDAEVGLVHGDCKPSQFLIGQRHVALLDFDHCGMADPASDVGTFLASLRQLGVRQWLKEQGSAAAAERSLWLQTLEQRFLGEYCAASGRGPDFRWRATWYEAVALLRKALRSFARSPHSPLPATLVDEAWRCLATLSPASGDN